MKTSIIEVALPTANVSAIQSVLEQCLLETGDLLIGRQTYDDQTLLVVRMLGDSIPAHLKMLAPAFYNEQIDSFQIIACHLFKIVFKTTVYENTLRRFPLHMGESWFASSEEKNTAYLCLNVPHLRQEQICWLTTETSIARWTGEL